MFVVDNEVAWVGGVNLMKYSFDNFDLMVKTTDTSVIYALLDQFPRVNNLRRNSNYSIKCGDDLTFMVDTGSNTTSLIYKEVHRLVEDAKRNVLFISQFPPDGKLLSDIIILSKNGVKTTIVTSRSDDYVFTTYPHKFMYGRLLSIVNKNRNIKLIHFTKKVHVKLLIIDNAIAVFGSHNFSSMGGL